MTAQAEYDHWLHVARLAFGHLAVRVEPGEDDASWDAYRAPTSDSIGDDADDYLGYVYDDGGTFWFAWAIHTVVTYPDGKVDRRYTGNHRGEEQLPDEPPRCDPGYPR